jgi:tetratricopeptide (TPR) repeat protein
MPVFFRELAGEGRVDRAAGLARNAVRGQPDFWMPVLFTRLRSGEIFAKPGDLRVRPRELQVLNLRLVLLAVSILALVLVVAGVGYLLLSPPPKPKEMDAGFNVAVARFMDVDESDQPIKDEQGEKIAEYIAERLDAELEALGIKDFDVWGPDYTGAVVGEDPEARAEVAGEIAKRIKAQVLVYGVIKHAGNDSSFQPEFVVSSDGFRSHAPEITGQNQLGKPLYIHLPFERRGLEAENPAFIARSEALNLITKGLVFFAKDQYLQAMEYFQQAVDLPNWLDNAGKEIAYLLLGNTRARQASRELDTSLVPKAIADYEAALLIQEREYNAVYGRALVGKASAIYVLAFLDPQNPPMPETVDRTRLDEAEALYLQALALEDQPESSRLPYKIALGLGQVYQLEALLGEVDGLEKARQQYDFVVQSYLESVQAEEEKGGTADDEAAQGDPLLGELASFAYARLALMEADKGNYDQALKLYDDSITIASPYWAARYTTDLALVYAQWALDLAESGDKEAALERIQQAIQQLQKGRDLASNLPDQALIDEAQQWLEMIRQIEDEIEGG